MYKRFVNLILIILLYSVLFFPSLMSIDKVAEHFFALAVLNIFYLIGSLFLLNKNEFSFKKILEVKEFFVFILLLIWAAISLIYSYNLPESIIELSEITSFVVSIILLYFLIKNTNYSVKLLFWISLFTLFFEQIFLWKDYLSLTNNTFFSDYNVSNLKGLFMNKNIASASIIIKIPFAIYLAYYTKNYILKALILFTAISAVVLVILGSARAFLIALLAVLFFFILFIILERRAIKYSLIGSSVLLLGILFGNTLSQTSGRAINKRLETIQNIDNDQSAAQRIRYYKHGITHILNNPIIGVGIGNWKLKSVEYDAKNINNYIIPYNMHNDFLELGAELGIFGMLLYISVFILVAYKLLDSFFRNKKLDNRILSFTLITSFLIYFIDANFNFPLTRTESQVNFIFLFVIYLLKTNEKPES